MGRVRNCWNSENWHLLQVSNHNKAIPPHSVLWSFVQILCRTGLVVIKSFLPSGWKYKCDMTLDEIKRFRTTFSNIYEWLVLCTVKFVIQLWIEQFLLYLNRCSKSGDIYFWRIFAINYTRFLWQNSQKWLITNKNDISTSTAPILMKPGPLHSELNDKSSYN